MSRIILCLMVVILLCACTSEPPEESPTETAADPTFSGMGGLPTLPAGTAAPRPTLPVDEALFPIEPDPAGQALYETHCASCHGMDGEGQYPDPYAPNEQGLIGAPPHDNSGHTWHHPDPVLFRIIYEGQQAPGFLPMPAFKEQLSPEEIIAILAYIKTWWGTQELATQQQITRDYLEQR